MARLDVPTFSDYAVQRQIEASWTGLGGSSVAWSTISSTSHIASLIVTILSQTSVLIGVLYEQRDGPLLAVVSSIQSLLQWVDSRPSFVSGGIFPSPRQSDTI
jgi:hypothetical protein